MTAKSHVATSIGIVLIPFILDIADTLENIEQLAIFMAGVIAGSLFPDIDEEHSYIGKKLPLISGSANAVIGHRTLTHNFFVWIAVGFYAFYIDSVFLFAFSIGAFLHILEDSMTNGGVKWALKPLYGNFKLLPKRLLFSTNGRFENYIYIPSIILVVIVEVAYLFINAAWRMGI